MVFVREFGQIYSPCRAMRTPYPCKPSFILGRPGSNQCCLLTMDQCAWRGSVFERGPFRSCPRCRKEATFGLLSVDGSMLTRRCKACMYMNAEPLPPLNSTWTLTAGGFTARALIFLAFWLTSV